MNYWSGWHFQPQIWHDMIMERVKWNTSRTRVVLLSVQTQQFSFSSCISPSTACLYHSAATVPTFQHLLLPWWGCWPWGALRICHLGVLHAKNHTHTCTYTYTLISSKILHPHNQTLPQQHTNKDGNPSGRLNVYSSLPVASGLTPTIYISALASSSSFTRVTFQLLSVVCYSLILQL